MMILSKTENGLHARGHSVMNDRISIIGCFRELFPMM